MRVVEKEDPLPRAIPSWPEESSALTTSTDFYIGHSVYLHSCILCICTFGLFVSAFLLHLFGFQTLESHCCTRPLIRKLSWHITLQEQRRPWLTFFRMYFYSFRLNFSSIFYFCCSCSLQCNIITRHQLTRKPQIRACQYETWFWSWQLILQTRFV